MHSSKIQGMIAALAMLGATPEDLVPGISKPNQIGTCKCGGRYYITPESKKPRCASCKKLMPKEELEEIFRREET